MIVNNSNSDITILFLEDEIAIAEMYKNILSRRGYNVIVKHNGEECIEYLNNQKNPDIIILDLNLPGITGVDVLKSIRFKKKTKNIPVIIHSVRGIKQTDEILQTLNVQAYIEKPVLPDVIISEIKKILKV